MLEVLPMVLGRGLICLFGKKFANIFLPPIFDLAWHFSSTCPFVTLFKKKKKQTKFQHDDIIFDLQNSES